MAQPSLFDEIERPDLRGRFNAEPQFTYLNISARPSAARVRELMDSWYQEVPKDARADVRSRFRSPDDIAHLGAFTELYCAALLRCHGFGIQIHALTSSKRTHIDFLAARDGNPVLLLESVVSGDSDTAVWEHKLLKAFYYEVNKLKQPDFLVMAKFRQAGTQAPSGRKARNYLEEKLRAVDWKELWSAFASADKTSVPEWVWQDEGWEICFEPIPKAPEMRGIVDGGSRVVGIQMDKVRSGVPGGDWLDSLEKKAARYGKPELPYIISINGLGMSHFLETLPDALFGHRKVDIDLKTKKGTPGRVPNGLWVRPKGPRYRRVSGVLAIKHAGPWSFAQCHLELWHNPWADRPVDPEWWQVAQHVPDQVTGTMVKREGKTAAELFGLEPSWPGDD